MGKARGARKGDAVIERIEGKVAKDDVWHLVVTKAAKRDTWRQMRPEGPMRASHTGIARQPESYDVHDQSSHSFSCTRCGASFM